MASDLSMFSLAGRVALVTGSSRGLGLAMAEGLAQAGATVVLNGRDPASLNREADALRRQGRKAAIAAFDATDVEAGRDAIDSIVREHGNLHILIGNAGMNRRAPLDLARIEDWDEIVSTNLRANFALAKHAAPAMKRAGYGRIVFTTSLTGILGRATIHAYVASKSGLAGIARSLAAELGESGITCNAIAPGYFETEMNAPLLADRSFVDRVNSRVPLRRWGKPAELAGVAILLASEAGAYINGQQIAVDGGYSTTM